MKSAKIFLFLNFIFLVIILIASCKDDNNVVTPPPANGPFTLTGAILNYPGGSVIAKARIYKFAPLDSFFIGTDTIDNSAQLNMTLATPPADFLLPIVLDSNIVISDTTATSAGISYLPAYNFSGEVIAQISKKNFDSIAVVGSFLIQYFFLNKNVTINGYDTTITGPDTSVSGYHLILASGWNAITIKLTDERTNFTQVDYTNGETSGATWRFETGPVPSTFRKYLLSY